MWPAPNSYITQKHFEESLSKSKRFSQGFVKALMLSYQASSAYHWIMYIPSIKFSSGLTLTWTISLSYGHHTETNNKCNSTKDGMSSKICRATCGIQTSEISWNRRKRPSYRKRRPTNSDDSQTQPVQSRTQQTIPNRTQMVPTPHRHC